ncbi:MAG TPA: hypothetical protein VG476_04525 [Acidimicrobiales bacterium]|nr:hypothetical protein [Acidimicrobiales bacterium]
MPAHAGERMPCRTCGTEVIFLRHEGTGKLAPIEVQPRLLGRFAVDFQARTYRSHFGIVPKGMQLHDNHYANCPHAQIWRLAREREAAFREGRQAMTELERDVATDQP